MKIAVCGSMSCSEEMVGVKTKLSALSHEAVLPRRCFEYANGALRPETRHESTENKIKFDLLRDYFGQIKGCDAVLVVNPQKNGVKDYIGGNAFLEMGFAHVLNKKVFLLYDIPALPYADEIMAMQPITLQGDLSKINDYL